MLYDFNPTVRKYPRTMLEAFPYSIESAQWMEHYKAPTKIMDVAWYFLASFAALAMAAAIIWM